MDGYIDSQQLIREVEKCPGLYHTELLFKHEWEKKKAWEDISSIIIFDWQDLDDTEQGNVAHRVKLRWRSIRDSLVKSLKPDKYHIAGHSKKKKYRYHQELQFILPLLGKSPIPEGDIKTEDPLELCGLRGDSTSSARDDYTYMWPSHDSSDVPIASGDATPAKFAATIDPRRQSSSAAILKNILQPRRKPQSLAAASDRDPDRMFLLSLMPNFKRIHPNDRASAQIAVIRAISKYEYAQPSGCGPQNSTASNCSTLEMNTHAATPTTSLSNSAASEHYSDTDESDLVN